MARRMVSQSACCKRFSQFSQNVPAVNLQKCMLDAEGVLLDRADRTRPVLAHLGHFFGTYDSPKIAFWHQERISYLLVDRYGRTRVVKIRY